jgi:1,4-alpha-glucan branching enzyme
VAKGYLAIVLHAHLPFVRHPEKERFLEENWLYQAVTECYLPLLDALTRLAEEGYRYRITLSLSPPLITMLTDELLTRRYAAHLERLIRLAGAEKKRTAGTELYQLAVMYEERFERFYELFVNAFQCNLASAFGSLCRRGVLELMTTCATHAYLPLVRNQEARRAQIVTGLEVFRRQFGFNPRGFWLPECGYAPGMDELLAACGLEYFFVETHGLLSGSPPPSSGVYVPVSTPAGVAAFGRDPETSRQVWDRKVGYPGDFWYREYYRDIGYELPWEYIEPFLPSGETRTDTGFKYYRVTGTEEKRLYEPHLAFERTVAHVEHFLYHRRLQVEDLAERTGTAPVVVAPYDAELFGHWWYEGPQWLEYLIRMVGDQDVVALATPSDYLQAYPPQETAVMGLSSWGEGGYSEVWLNPANDWIYRHLHRAESRMIELCDLHPRAVGAVQRALNQAARELLLAESSDWPFILRVGSAVQYATRRLTEHISRFNYLTDQILDENIDEAGLEAIEAADNIFPAIDYRVYSRFWTGGGPQTAKPLRVLLLTWEYPPRIVGGLGRHVHDLSRALAAQGDEVSVVTAPVPECPSVEDDEGVRVYRVPGETCGENFLDWVAAMNRQIISVTVNLLEGGKEFDVIHAHDWLVEAAALELAERFGLPLVATIHATEYGRCQGIHNETQNRIHLAERRLVSKAGLIICCSEYMKQEVSRLFNVTPALIKVIPNGVDPEVLGVKEWRGFVAPVTPAVLYLGRLVPEKGVQDLIRALPLIEERVPGVRAVLCGQGPYEPELRQLSTDLNLTDRVHFTGFVDGQIRNRFLLEAAAAVFPSHYEPFGIVALEAMAAQVPVIVGDAGGLSEVVEHGIDGFKAPPGRPDLLARYVGEVLLNPPLAEELCRRGWRKVRSTYNWKHIAAVTHETYRLACGKT